MPVSPSVAPLAMPGQKPAVLMHDLAPWVWEAGGDFCSDDMREATSLERSAMAGFVRSGEEVDALVCELGGSLRGT